MGGLFFQEVKMGTVRLWNPSTTECVQVFTGHRRGVVSVTMTPDRRIVISASDDRTIRFWERATGKMSARVKGHKTSRDSVGS
jgi:transcription initiation factor TFIID subunit 5